MTITSTILGGLGLFLFGMKIMSEALQNAAGDGLKNALWKVTNNRFKGVLTGFTITSVIQSSSATTVMVVSFVSAGLISMSQSIGLILGANIGTTITGWLVAIIGFKFKIKALALPAIAIGFFMRFLKKEKLINWGDVILGFGLLFLGLTIMSDAVKDLKGSDLVMNVMGHFHASNPLTTIAVVLIGSLVTMVIQSSSATMAMTMTLAVNGIIDFPTSCALILGENIGTTITANLAAIGSSVEARRSARVHLIFNLFGVVWVLLIFKTLFIPFIDYIVPGNPFISGTGGGESHAIADHMAAFHTVFNVLNTIIFLPFVNFLAKIAVKLVPDTDEQGEDGSFHLKFISTTLLSTPAMNLNQARLETKRMMGIVQDMYEMLMDVFHQPDTKLGPIVKKIKRMEDHTDLLEMEISQFLVKVSQSSITEEQSQDITLMMHRVHELERIGDHCLSLLKLMRKKYDSKIEFTSDGMDQIAKISAKVREFLELIGENIESTSTDIIEKSNEIENRINKLRKEMRKEHVRRLKDGKCEVDSGLIFIDMLTSFEKIGDHAYNIAEGISGQRL
jgi:phosphate:Na+ symporter